MAARRASLVLALLAPLAAAGAAPARAGGPALDLLSPRGVGRAGAQMVSDDGAAAVVLNPAALARRDEARGQLGLVVVDDGATFVPSGDGGAGGDGLVVGERGGATLHPVGGLQLRLGPLVVGVAVLDEARWARRFAAPPPGTPPDDVEALYPHRYAGLALAHRRRTVGAAVAWRAGEWLAIGAGVTVSRVSLDEARRGWAGFAGRDRVGDAARDVDLAVEGRDGAVLGGSVGVLVAPVDVPIELAASAAWSAPARLAGVATARAVRPGEFPAASDAGATATAELASPLVVRTGARWLAERWLAELTGEVWAYPGAAPVVWTVDGVTVTDETGATAALGALPSRLARRPHGAVRAALDVEAVPGLAWLTAGYAYATAGTSRLRHTPVGGDLGGHTVALGAEVASDGLTVTLGIARTFAAAVDVDATVVRLDNPFAAGDAPATLGRHDASRDVVAVTVEAAW